MDIDPSVAWLATAKECEQFVENVKDKFPALVPQARRRAVELRAAEAGATGEVELRAPRVVYAYGAVLKAKHGKAVGAARTRALPKRHGAVAGVERAVDTAGYAALVALGMADLTFEALVLRHRDAFSPAAVRRCEERLTALAATAAAAP